MKTLSSQLMGRSTLHKELKAEFSKELFLFIFEVLQGKRFLIDHHEE